MTAIELTERENELYQALVAARFLVDQMLDGEADGYEARRGVDDMTKVLEKVRGSKVDNAGDPYDP